MRLMLVVAFSIFASLSSIAATDITNQDDAIYKVTVQGEGNLSISIYTLGPNQSLFGLCEYSFCSFTIQTDKVNATKNARLRIRQGKFSE